MTERVRRRWPQAPVHSACDTGLVATARYQPAPASTCRREADADRDDVGGGRFVVVGAFVLDCLISAAGLPAWGHDLRADEMRTVPGGKAFNQAVTLARLGARVAAVGAVGRDAVGVAIRSALVAEGVDVSAMPVVEGAATPVCVVHARRDGEKAVVWRVPEVLAGTARELDAAAAALDGQVDAALVTFEFAAQAADLVTAAAKGGMRVIVNPAPAARELDLADAVPWELVDVIVPNETEARALLAGQPGARGPAGQLADAVGDRLGVPTVCVTLAGRGCVLRTGGRTSRCPAPVASVVDTTAASDAFTAVLAARLVAGWPPAEAVRLAQRAAALVVGRPGGYEALPTADELAATVGARTDQCPGQDHGDRAPLGEGLHLSLERKG
ncbi:carbohydrate kinase family protein [Frankia sp. AgKG'84/4]|uniref:carbohydrate kinase family protein n=1 Tax=Frankia sp. AgKG'84/4 TaxID=573490 RepID=UPI00200C2396|nr:PfkB family carbohydrate kinase [Frankia sp. AgKG'84/4]MCL9793852.1 PfkB family carbohydrate kinase [Frankia sp. AgKG'84/4]